MSAPTNPLPVLMAVLLAGGLACKKPEPVKPQPVKEAAPVVDTKAQDDDARRKAEADATAKAQADADAARKAEAAKAEALRKAAEAALKDVHFGFDKSDILESDKAVLTAIADFMKAYPEAKVAIEGNCDERGTSEYNLALGERRAHAALDYLKGLGVDESRLSTVSYGKEKPSCTESTETCWKQNRRDHFTLK
jgi:peptidoglycan-associated lipoprotein